MKWIALWGLEVGADEITKLKPFNPRTACSYQSGNASPRLKPGRAKHRRVCG
ncbi:hypothetical protein O9992_10090 [Vibrio lentus]|nr:hypothetical protein [Vibrio lentus]